MIEPPGGGIYQKQGGHPTHDRHIFENITMFKKDLAALIKLVDYERVINPFMETSSDLVTLDT